MVEISFAIRVICFFFILQESTGWQDDVSEQVSNGEDTEDASEAEDPKVKYEFTEMKEQMYQQKLAMLKRQLQQLEEGTLPEYVKKLRKIDQAYEVAQCYF